jgi:hypothetical protein
LSRRWKPVERKLAELLGAERVPVSGRARGWAPDLEHPDYALEVKSRAKVGVALTEGMDQAVKAAAWAKRRQGRDKLPVVLLHQDGQHYENTFVVVRLKDARDWWGIGDSASVGGGDRRTTHSPS